MSTWFDLLGWPHTLSTKSSPHFNKDFTAFCKNHNIAHNITSPTHTDKCTAQTAIRSAKQLLIRCKLEEEDYQTALANMKDTATENGYTPKQILLGAPQWTEGQDNQSKGETDVQSKQRANRQKEAQDDLDIGDRVLIKHHKTGRWNKEAEVVEQRQDKFSYVIRDDTKTRTNYVRPCAMKYDKTASPTGNIQFKSGLSSTSSSSVDPFTSYRSHKNNNPPSDSKAKSEFNTPN